MNDFGDEYVNKNQLEVSESSQLENESEQEPSE